MGTEERKIYVAFLIVILLIIVVIIIFFVSFFRQQQSYKNLQKAKIKAEIEASEAERFALATELHNDIGPQLSGIKMLLQLIETNDASRLEECKGMLDQSVSQIRSIASRLAPLSVMRTHFLYALQQYGEKVEKETGLHIEINEKENFVLEESSHAHLYRILQEIILNTVKHAQATKLRIEISREEHQMLIRTADDGIGFDPEKIAMQKNKGLGLLSIGSRIYHLNGTIIQDISSIKGTRYNIRIPLAHE